MDIGCWTRAGRERLEGPRTMAGIGWTVMGENWVSVAWQGSWRSLGDGQGCSLSPGYESRPRYGVRMRVRACVHEIQNLGRGEERDPIGPSALKEILECHLLDDIGIVHHVRELFERKLAVTVLVRLHDRLVHNLLQL